jgi:hypothetical protein
MCRIDAASLAVDICRLWPKSFTNMSIEGNRSFLTRGGSPPAGATNRQRPDAVCFEFEPLPLTRWTIAHVIAARHAALTFFAGMAFASVDFVDLATDDFSIERQGLQHDTEILVAVMREHQAKSQSHLGRRA